MRTPPHSHIGWCKYNVVLLFLLLSQAYGLSELTLPTSEYIPLLRVRSPVARAIPLRLSQLCGYAQSGWISPTCSTAVGTSPPWLSVFLMCNLLLDVPIVRRTEVSPASTDLTKRLGTATSVYTVYYTFTLDIYLIPHIPPSLLHVYPSPLFINFILLLLHQREDLQLWRQNRQVPQQRAKYASEQAGSLRRRK